MMRFVLRVLGWVVLLVSWGLAMPEESAPPCFKIPSAEELGSNETITTYREQYRPHQYLPEATAWMWVDVAVLAVILLAGGVMVWRRVHCGRFWILGVITLVYFGWIRGGCICPVGAVANLSIGLRHPELVGVGTALIFLLPLGVAFFMGRVFCVAGCPLGAVQDLLGGKRPRVIPLRSQRVLRILPLLVLIATVWLALRGTCFLVCLLDPYKPLFFLGCGWLQRIAHALQGGLVEPGVLRVGDGSAWGIFAFAILLGRWVHRPFCRFICPYGVLLGGFSMVALSRRRIEQSVCVQCGICEKQCPVQAIERDPKTQEFRISAYHCIQCSRCASLCRKNSIG